MEDITTTDGNLRVLPSADLPDLDFVQWIFPFINFTCYGKITRWTLRVEQLEDLDLDEDELWYIPQLSVWRPSKDQNLAREKIGSYELQSSTNETIFPVNDQGPVFEYKMPFAMTVEPSDIIGIRMPLDAKTRRVRTTKPLFLELSRGNATSKSYSTLHNRTTISVSSETRELHTYLPLISVDIREFHSKC